MTSVAGTDLTAATSVKILTYRPPARLIRAKYKVILRLLGHTWILDYILLIPDSRHWILYSLTVELGFRIPIVSEIWIRRVEV